MSVVSETRHEWLIRKLNQSFPQESCLLWPFALNGKGYGNITVNGKTERVHRVVYALHHGELPEPPLTIRHLCGIRECYNPFHLAPGTQSDNEADKITHQTARRGWAKLHIDDVKAIRASNTSNRLLAEQYDVSPEAIRRIKIRMTWAWVKDG